MTLMRIIHTKKKIVCRHLIREYRKSPAALTTAPKAKLRFSREQIPGMWAATTLLRRMFATMVLIISAPSTPGSLPIATWESRSAVPLSYVGRWD